MFSVEFNGPLIEMIGEDFSNPNCQLGCADCSLVISMRYARYSNIETPPAVFYFGKLVCRGLRPKTDAEKEDARSFQLDESAPICDLEVIVARDF
jgi:hypothetical protein